MPHVRKLTPEEIQAVQNKGKSQRKLVEEQYDAILSDYAIGEYGEALLDPEEKRLMVQNRLRAATVRRGLNIMFRRTSGDLVRFQIIEPTQQEATPKAAPVVVASDTPQARKKGGRPKKTA